MKIRGVFYIGFLISLGCTFLLHGTEAFIGCGSITLFLGLISGVMLSNQLHQHERNQVVWIDRSRQSRERKVAIWQDLAIYIESGGNRGMKTRATLPSTVPAWLKDPEMRQEWHKQDVLQAIATYSAELGGVTDGYVRHSIQEIKRMPHELQFDAFELLDTVTQNGHPRGMAADVRDEILKAQYDSMGYGGGA